MSDRFPLLISPPCGIYIREAVLPDLNILVITDTIFLPRASDVSWQTDNPSLEN